MPTRTRLWALVARLRDCALDQSGAYASSLVILRDGEDRELDLTAGMRVEQLQASDDLAIQRGDED